MGEDAIIDSSILALALSESGLIFAAKADGLHVSKQTDINWKRVFPREGQAGIPVTATAVSKSNTILIGIPGGIGTSSDGGSSWVFAPLPEPMPIVTSFAIDETNGIVLAGTDQDGIFRSVDGGNTWKSWNFGLLTASVNTIVVSESGSFLAGTTAGIFESRNNGRSWEPAFENQDDQNVLAIVSLKDRTLLGIDNFGLVIEHIGDDQIHLAEAFAFKTVHSIVMAGAHFLTAHVEDTVFTSDLSFSWAKHYPDSHSGVTAISDFAFIGDDAGIFVGTETGSVTFLSLLEATD